MPGFLLHKGATVQCAHAGQAQPTATNPHVTVGGQPIVTQAGAYTVSGCSYPPQSGGPCATAQWVSAATRVTANNQPVLLQDSKAVCTPTGTPLNIIMTQMRVKGM
ncbi:MAG: PAAR-like protein [Candidatus Poribacteria bacterium]|nr:PAAR-like protein [Candidatus Poribacteria bacterium]